MLNHSQSEFRCASNAAFVPLVLQISTIDVIRLHCGGRCRATSVKTVHRLQAPIQVRLKK